MRLLQNIAKVSAGGLMASALACSGSSFSGGTGKAGNKTPTPTPAPQQTEDDAVAAVPTARPAAKTAPSLPHLGGSQAGQVAPAAQIPAGANVQIPANCGAGGATQAKLMSPSIANGQPGNHVTYQIFLTDCNGKPQPFVANTLLFNFAASLNDDPSYGYTVSDSTHQISGVLKPGPANPNVWGNYDWETDQPVTFASSDSSITFTINLEGEYLYYFAPSTANSLATTVAFGNAAPVYSMIPLSGN